MSIEERLAAMDDAYENAEAASAGRVPDGEYVGLIERFDFWQKEGGGPLKLITEIRIDEGDYANLSAPTVWHELEDPERIKWTKGYLETLGLQGIKLSELKTELEKIAGKTRVGIRIATKGEYRNTYVNEVIDQAKPESEFADQPESKAEADDDSVPF